MIVSASRRTDIPAFYGNWFMNRIRDGFCLVANPFRPSMVSRVSLARSDVDAIVFWTKNPEPLFPRLDELDRAGFPCCFLFTLNPYPAFMEPALPDLRSRLDIFRALSRRLGPRRVIWRYDPLILSQRMDADFHIRAFEDIARELSGSTDRVIVSVIDWYRKTQRRLNALEAKGLDDFSRDPFADPDLPRLIASWQRSAGNHGLQLQSCAEDRRLEALGIRPGGCIDAERINDIFKTRLPIRRARGQRPDCLCAESKDIGAVNTCLHGCAYCYSTVSDEAARRKAARHDPDSPLLVPA